MLSKNNTNIRITLINKLNDLLQDNQMNYLE